MKTARGVSPVSPVQVTISLLAFIVVYTLIGIAAYYLMVKYARKGPDALPKADAA
jgi:cytochrome bd ubiquinol oxidase subunit I